MTQHKPKPLRQPEATSEPMSDRQPLSLSVPKTESQPALSSAPRAKSQPVCLSVPIEGSHPHNRSAPTHARQPTIKSDNHTQRVRRESPEHPRPEFTSMTNDAGVVGGAPVVGSAVLYLVALVVVVMMGVAA